MTQKDQREREAREYAEKYGTYEKVEITDDSPCERDRASCDSCGHNGIAFYWCFLAGASSEARRVVEWCEKWCAGERGILASDLIEALKREFGGEK